jgi:hypothetical protein
MQIEIQILSGARKSECLQLDAEDLHVGDEPSYDLYFDPAKDPGVRGVRARLRGHRDGWCIQRMAGGSVLVNHKLLESELPIRSGDVVRLSPFGPDFRFILAPARDESAGAGSGGAAASGTACAAARGSQRRPATCVGPSAASAAAPAGGAAVAVAPGHWRRRSVAVVAGLALAAALLLAVVALARRWHPSPVVVDQPTISGAASPEAAGGAAPTGKTPSAVAGGAAPAGKVSGPGVSQQLTGSGSKPPGPAPSPPSPPKPPPVPPPALSPLVVLAVENEQKHELEPFAVACAVDLRGHQMLLTSGRIARIMSLFQKRYYAMWSGGAAAGTAVVELDRNGIYVHMLYSNTLDENDLRDAQFFDLGVLSCVEKFPGACTPRSLASQDVLEQILPETPLHCCIADRPRDFPLHGVQAGDREYRLATQSKPLHWSREIRLLAEGGGQRPDRGPRLFEFSGPNQDFLEGSPVCNEAEQVVAVFTKTAVAEAAVPGAGSREGPLRATPVSAEMVNALWTGVPREQWVHYSRNRRGAAADPPRE